MTKIKSPFPYLGGKTLLAQKIKDITPLTAKIHVEVFCGSAVLTANIDKSKYTKIVINDMDDDITTFFKVVQNPDAFPDFLELCKKVDHNPNLYKHYKKNVPTDAIEKAFRWFWGQRQCFGGMAGAYWISKIDSHKSAVENLPNLHEHFKDIEIRNGNWLSVMLEYDSKETFYYLDPPYSDSSRVSGEYRHEMTKPQQIEFISHLKKRSLQGKFAVSGYRTEDTEYTEKWPLYENSLGWCHLLYKNVPLRINNRRDNTKEKRRHEFFWFNYELPKEKIEFLLNEYGMQYFEPHTHYDGMLELVRVEKPTPMKKQNIKKPVSKATAIEKPLSKKAPAKGKKKS